MSLQFKLLRLESASNKVTLNPKIEPVLKQENSNFVLDSVFLDLKKYKRTVVKLEIINKKLINQNVTPPGPSFVGLVTNKDTTNRHIVMNAKKVIKLNKAVTLFFIR
jgi:hypothetical protein